MFFHMLYIKIEFEKGSTWINVLSYDFFIQNYA